MLHESKKRIKETKQTTETYQIDLDENHHMTYTKVNGKPVSIEGVWEGTKVMLLEQVLEVCVELIEASRPQGLPQYPPGTRDFIDQIRKTLPPPKYGPPTSFNEAAYTLRSINISDPPEQPKAE